MVSSKVAMTLRFEPPVMPMAYQTSSLQAAKVPRPRVGPTARVYVVPCASLMEVMDPVELSYVE